MRDCGGEGPPSQRLEISPPPDGPPVVLWVHEVCLARSRDVSVAPDDPADRGRIPARARCAFCGRALPIVGSHPFVFDVAGEPVPQRFWAHAGCMHERFTPRVMVEVGKAIHG